MSIKRSRSRSLPYRFRSWHAFMYRTPGMRSGSMVPFLSTVLLLVSSVFLFRCSENFVNIQTIFKDNSIKGRRNELRKSPRSFEHIIPYNLHAHYPMVCDDKEDRDWKIHPSVANYLDLIKNNRETDQREHKQGFTTVGHFASPSSRKDLVGLTRLQACTYSLLDEWSDLARRHSIQPWAAHGGSAIGARCFGSMNPWDDDIDISIWDCSALDRLWSEGRLVNETYPELDPKEYSVDAPHQTFEPRLIEGDLLLLKGGRCCHWYKLKSVAQSRHKIKAGSDIVGLDLECMNLTTFENQVRKDAGWDDYMSRPGHAQGMDTVMFGPTSIQVLPQPMLDRYVELRYGKRDPCNFPFRSGQDPIPGLRHANRSIEAVGLYKYLSDIQAHQLHWIMANWYTTKSMRALWLRRAMEVQTDKSKLYWERQQIVGAMNRVEIDTTISPSSCQLNVDSESNRTFLHVIAFNAERGTHWDDWADLIRTDEALNEASVLLISNLDVGMARSGNVHTARRLALELGMNYAFGLEFVDLTRGTSDEQEATQGQRDALSLSGLAVLSKCLMYDPLVVRDQLSTDQLSLATGERRLGGHMGLFIRLSVDGEQGTSTSIVVGNAHNISQSALASPQLRNVFGQTSNVIFSGETQHAAVNAAREGRLKTLINVEQSSPGCGLLGLPRLSPIGLFSNLEPARRAAVPPCYGDLGASTLSSRAVATATIAVQGL